MSLSATNLAVSQTLHCDLYLHNVYHKQQVTGSNPQPLTPSGISQAHFKRGLDWENTLFKWLDDKGLLLRISSPPMSAIELRDHLTFDGWSESPTEDPRDHFYATGLSFWPPKDELETMFHKFGTTPVEFGMAKPDLLEIWRKPDGTFRWRVIDAKASKFVKTSHHVQLYFYALCLNLMLKAPEFCSEGTAAIWLPPEDGFDLAQPSFDDIRLVDVSLLSTPMNDFLFRRLPAVLTLPTSDVSWHLNPACSYCPYLPNCQERATHEGVLGLMPNISIEDVNVLKTLLGISRKETRRITTDIEDLGRLFANETLLNKIQRSFPVTVKRAKRIVAVPSKSKNSISPVIQAARKKTIRVIPRRYFGCPNREEIAVVISLLQDPSVPGIGIVCYSISVFSAYHNLPTPISGPGGDLISSLSYVIQNIMNIHPRPTTQFYMFSTAEHAALQAVLIKTAISASPLDRHHVQRCIGALAEGAGVLQTAFQPMILGGVLLDFLTKPNQTRIELEACLDRMGLPATGSISVLRERIQEELQKYKSEKRQRENILYRREALGQLPSIVVVKGVVERLIALPIPGFWDLPECAQVLTPTSCPCPSDGDIFDEYASKKSQGVLNSMLQRRNQVIFAVLNKVRSMTSEDSLLVNEAKPLSTSVMDICREPSLRKLFFMQQFEVLNKLNEHWKSRIEGCPEAPILQYSSSTRGPDATQHTFTLLSGNLDLPSSEKDRHPFYDFILVPDTDISTQLPAEALFDDLGVSNLVFPLNSKTFPRWKDQHPHVQQNLVVADIQEICLNGNKTNVILRISGWHTFPLVQGASYRLSPRLVDFNVSKVLSTLFELDLQCSTRAETETSDPVPFVQLIVNPRSFKQDEAILDVAEKKKRSRKSNGLQRLFKQLANLDVEAAGPLSLKTSQNHAAQRILANRLSVVWGPPGTGKTHTISVSILRLLELQLQDSPTSQSIFLLTAMTHAAINACLNKLHYLIACYRQIPELPSEWLDHVQINNVVNAYTQDPPNKGPGTYIYAGTVFQLYNFCKRYRLTTDCVIIDEAGQLSLSAASLVLRSVGPKGKIIIAGDSEQLAPILSARYPELKTGPLFGSILDLLMFWSKNPYGAQYLASDGGGSSTARPPSPTPPDSLESSQQWSQGTIVQLTENFRLNPDLGEFVSTIYSRRFRPQKSQSRELASALKSINKDFGKAFGLRADIVESIQWFLVALGSVIQKQPQTILKPPSTTEKENDLIPMVQSGPVLSEAETSLPVSLALIRLKTYTPRKREMVGYEAHVRAEAHIAAALVVSLQRCSPEENIFVATPHRIQRQAVKLALSQARNVKHDVDIDDNEEEDITKGVNKLDISLETPNRTDSPKNKRGKVTVDTIERLQGSEAAFVICLFTMPQASRSELSFLFERRRLNVAISRAKTLCIMVASPELLRPPVSIFADEEQAKGYSFLKAFERRAWSYNLDVEVQS